MNKTNKIPFARKIAKKKETVTILSIVCSLFFITASCGKSDFGVDADGDPLYDFYLYTNRGKPYNYYYGVDGKKEIFNIRKDKVVIYPNFLADTTGQDALISADTVAGWILATVEPKKTKLEDLWKMEWVMAATYALEYADNTTLLYPQNKIYIKTNKGLSPEEAFKKTGLTDKVMKIELFDKYNQGYIVTTNVNMSYLFRFCRKLYESGVFECAEPECIMEIKLD